MPKASGKAFALEVSAEVGRAYVARLREMLPKARVLATRGVLAELHVILIGDAAMSRLHRDFMQIDGPTDVMTFPIDLDGRGRAVSGEVYVCVPYAKREATARGTRAADEVLLYAVHGMLHLCGYDDRTDRDFATMHAAEDSILTVLGAGAVYTAGAGTRAAKNAPKAKRRGAPS
ncbi:MAG TPA: rRNA maturation RNase YbeY [Tepidisphaeraceae bacterium]|nr:rRNA maturation RNase YbeY [Tepidisphaeraceae bacterium]